MIKAHHRASRIQAELGDCREVVLNFANVVDRDRGWVEDLAFKIFLVELAFDCWTSRALLFEQAHRRLARELETLVFLAEDDEPLMHLVEEIDVLFQ